MQQTEFLRLFGDAIRRKRAAVFVGAGVSKGAGFPDWDGLIAPLRAAANVPASVQDATLAAEYALQELKLDEVERLLLDQLKDVTVSANDTLAQLLSIDFAEIWTTNFDTLIENSASNLDLVVDDDDYEQTSPTNGRRLTKLHGSIGTAPDGSSVWRSHPVITRSDFESFEREHPLKWAMLRAQFLTSSFLFLGFSFADPNVGALLRIVRSLPSKIRRLPHFAIMKPPSDADELREFGLFRQDLAAAGVHVIDIADYSDLPDLLRRLGRSALPPNVFVSGSFDEGSDAQRACTASGAMLAGLSGELAILSFDGPAARSVSRAYKTSLHPDAYRPERVRVFYRRSPEDDGEITVPRFGTAVFTEKDLDAMRLEVMSQVRVMLLIGGGTRTAEEAEMALTMGIPVVPLAGSGGTARTIWDRGREVCGFPDPGSEHSWSLLSNEDPSIAAGAAKHLLQQVLPA